MPRFRVTVRTTIYEYRTVEVTAASLYELNKPVADELYETVPPPQLNYCDVGDDDIVAAEEIQGVTE